MTSFEPNNTVETASVLLAGVYNITSTGDDWFKLNVSPGEIDLYMTPASGTDVNMVLYNSAMQVVGGNFAPGAEHISYVASATGSYYVKLYPTVATTSNYTLSVDLPVGTWSKTLDFGPIRDVPITLFDIDDDGKDEIFIGTSKGLDANLNEIRPAGLICLEDDGTVKWSLSFPAISGVDSQTGKTYNTTSVSTAPTFSDLDGDGSIDLVIGVGADTMGEAGANVVGQPGDKGGLYAVNGRGQILWYHQSLDVIGGASNTGDGRPDGVYGAPVVFDIDRDNQKEVIYNGWDQSTWILDAKTGVAEKQIHLADTIWSTPKVADLDGDNVFEILVSADITQNSNAGTTTGGIFHVIQADGGQNQAGFNSPIGNPLYTTLRGKWEEQALWSSPVAADLDGDGKLEIVYGTGNFFHDQRGSYIRVWEDDGAAKFKLITQGRTFATPMVADLNNDGRMEVVAATLDGYVHAWDRNGNSLFAVQPVTAGNAVGNAIFSSPIAVDLTGDGNLEIMFSQGSQMVILSSTGAQLSSANSRDFVFEFNKGSPAVKDIDRDNKLDIVSGGNTASHDQAVVFRWANPYGGAADTAAVGRYQINQSLSNLTDFVERFYETVLGRPAEAHGRNDWVDRLYTGTYAGADVATGFIFSQEFTNRNLNDSDYVTTLYRAFFNREPDSAGYNTWIQNLTGGAKRSEVLNGFIYSQEFKNLCAAYAILPSKA